MTIKKSVGKSLTRNDLVPVDPIAGWQAELRQSAFNAINGDDVKEIVETIVKKAKQGDAQACKMVFEYLLGRGNGGAALPQALATVNNLQVNYAGPAADGLAATPIRKAKLDRLRQLASNGEDLFPGS